MSYILDAIMTKNRRELLNNILFERLDRKISILALEGGFPYDIAKCVFVKVYIENDSDFDDFFEEITVKVALTNACLKDVEKLDYHEIAERLSSTS